MPNPFGITEVDIPGAIGAYEAGQTARVNRLLRQQQLQQAETEANRRQRFDEILLGNATSPKAGAAGAYAQAPAPNVGQQVANGVMGAVGVQPSAAPAPASPAPPTLEVPPDVMRQLAVLDPERANQIFTAFHAMDTASAERVQRANLFLANRAQWLLANVPQNQWQAEIQRMAPDLAAHGVSPEMISRFQPTPQSLQGLIQDSMDVAHLAEAANPRPMVEPQGGRIIDANRTDAQGRPRVISESPTIAGPNGEIYARPPQMSSQPVPQTAINPRTGQRLQLNPQTNAWEPVPNEAPAFRPGGAASGQQGFQ